MMPAMSEAERLLGADTPQFGTSSPKEPSDWQVTMPAMSEAERLSKAATVGSYNDEFFEKFNTVLTPLGLDTMMMELFTRFDAFEQQQQRRFGTIESKLESVTHVTVKNLDDVTNVVDAVQEQRRQLAKIQSAIARQDRMLARLSTLQSESATELCALQMKMGDDRSNAFLAKFDELETHAEIVQEVQIPEDTDVHDAQSLVVDVTDIRETVQNTQTPEDLEDQDVNAKSGKEDIRMATVKDMEEHRLFMLSYEKLRKSMSMLSYITRNDATNLDHKPQHVFEF